QLRTITYYHDLVYVLRKGNELNKNIYLVSYLKFFGNIPYSRENEHLIFAFDIDSKYYLLISCCYDLCTFNMYTHYLEGFIFSTSNLPYDLPLLRSVQ